MTIATLIEKYDTRVPRYTSYPTAPHFSAAITPQIYAGWLADLPADQALSLYLHVPFCEELCLYCGCNTAVVHHDGPRLAYAHSLAREIAVVAGAIGTRPRVSHIHWGGGTPTALPAASLISLMAHIRRLFDVAADAEIAIELDPRHLPADRLQALADMGVTRASLGVQDFDPRVQQAVGRIQSFATTQAAADSLRGRGIGAINLDLMYGLPYQTIESVVRTALQALALRPDRIAVFGYAHVPWMKRHQKLLPEAALPGAEARFAQRAAVEAVLTGAGFVAVGLDHFARADDALAQAAAAGTMHRNFQGYTNDAAPILLGFGASAIGSLPQGYAQNVPTVPQYMAAIARGELPVVHGIALSADDRLRRAVIERIMCDLQVDILQIAKTHGADPAGLLAAAPRLAGLQADGLIRWNGRQIDVTAPGRPFMRSIAACFDTYLASGPPVGTERHARAV